MGYFLAVCSTYNTFPQNYREKSLLEIKKLRYYRPSSSAPKDG